MGRKRTILSASTVLTPMMPSESSVREDEGILKPRRSSTGTRIFAVRPSAILLSGFSTVAMMRNVRVSGLAAEATNEIRPLKVSPLISSILADAPC